VTPNRWNYRATDAARAAAAIVLMTPGLSVVIDAIKESRTIFQRMNSYSMYRIAETLRVLMRSISGGIGIVPSMNWRGI
jgi:magnesium-transporting ATPase (P-type)